MWKCKLCEFSSCLKIQLLRHYRLYHGQYSTVSPLPCLYTSCMCTFTTFNSLKVHLSRNHSARRVVGGDGHDLMFDRAFHCPVCEFKQPFVEREMYNHLRGHLRKKKWCHVHLRPVRLKQIFTPHTMHTNAENIRMHQTMM